MNKTSLIAIVVALIIGVIMGSQIGCGHGSKASIDHADTSTHYIQRTDTFWRTLESKKYIPFTIYGKSDTVYLKSIEQVGGFDMSVVTPYFASTDTAAYSDTLRQENEFKAEIFDTIAGNRIIARRIRWAPIGKTEIRDISIVKKGALVKVFVGADAVVPIDNISLNRFDFVPGFSAVIADKYMVDLGYGLFGQQIRAGLKIKLSFKKQ